MWAFFFSCSFCVLPMNAKGVFIVCVYRNVYWLLILNITHHLCSASPALHHRHTPPSYFVSEHFFCPALVFPRVPSKRCSERIWEPERAISLCCTPPSAYTIATSATQNASEGTQNHNTKDHYFWLPIANSFLWLVKWHINTQSHNWHTYRRRSQKVIYNVLLCRSIKIIIINLLIVTHKLLIGYL